MATAKPEHSLGSAELTISQEKHKAFDALEPNKYKSHQLIIKVLKKINSMKTRNWNFGDSSYQLAYVTAAKKLDGMNLDPSNVFKNINLLEPNYYSLETNYLINLINIFINAQLDTTVLTNRLEERLPSLESEPDNDIRCRYAMILIKLGRRKKAEMIFQSELNYYKTRYLDSLHRSELLGLNRLAIMLMLAKLAEALGKQEQAQQLLTFIREQNNQPYLANEMIIRPKGYLIDDVDLAYLAKNDFYDQKIAEATLRAFIVNDPVGPDFVTLARYTLAYLSYPNPDPNLIIHLMKVIYKKLSTPAVPSLKGESYYLIAKIYLNQKDLPRALKILKKATLMLGADDPSIISIQTEVAKALWDEEQRKLALAEQARVRQLPIPSAGSITDEKINSLPIPTVNLATDPANQYTPEELAAARQELDDYLKTDDAGN